MKKRTINIQGKDIHLCYCAAVESGFEQIRGKSVFEFDWKRHEDLLAMVVASIVAAATAEGKEPVLSSNDILYNTSPKDIAALIEAVVALRNEWYEVPATAPKPEKTEEADGSKNA